MAKNILIFEKWGIHKNMLNSVRSTNTNQNLNFFKIRWSKKRIETAGK